MKKPPSSRPPSLIAGLAPLAPGFLEGEPSREVTLLIPARNSAHALERTVQEAVAYFSAQWPNQFEVILIPNPGHRDREDRSIEVAEKLARDFPDRVRVVPHRELPGKGAALRTGMREARGRQIFFTDADLPYELEFFTRAREKLGQGFALVTGNRRLPTSFFDVPVELLPITYSRHRLGLAFNRVVRWLFPIETTDTQAGIKAMSRELARVAFSRMECPGFFFDIEIFLAARANGLRTAELPVTLYLNTEKSTVRVLRESFLAAFWLSRVWFRQKRGDYAHKG